MNVTDALKWAVIYRLLAGASLLVGVGIVVLGFVLGFGEALELLLEDPLDPGPAIDRATPAITGLFILLGLVVWQVGSTTAFYLTLVRAIDESSATEVDPVRLKSEVLDGLDGRLRTIESEVAETRRSVGGDSGTATTFDGDPDTTAAEDVSPGRE